MSFFSIYFFDYLFLDIHLSITLLNKAPNFCCNSNTDRDPYLTLPSIQSCICCAAVFPDPWVEIIFDPFPQCFAVVRVNVVSLNFKSTVMILTNYHNFFCSVEEDDSDGDNKRSSEFLGKVFCTLGLYLKCFFSFFNEGINKT